jgi:hypothetical protein
MCGRKCGRSHTGRTDGSNRKHPERWSENYEVQKSVYKSLPRKGHGVMAKIDR